MAQTFPRIEPLGTDGLLVRFADRLDDRANRACVAFRAALNEAGLPGVQETASSLGSVLVIAEGDFITLERALAALVASRDWADDTPPPRKLWSIPCSFEGDDAPQLAEAAEMAGLSVPAAVESLVESPVRVLALGFAPGMPYLGILPNQWDLPRQTGLTPKVPKGALVVAVRQFVLFGTEAPTGWRQVGRTLFECFEPSRPAPIALAPGDEIRFMPVPAETLRKGAAVDDLSHGGATYEVLT